MDQNSARALDQKSARALVISAAKSNGFVLQPEAATAAAEEVSGGVRFDHRSGSYVPFDGEHRAFQVQDGRLVDLDLATHVIALARKHAGPATKAASNERPAPNPLAGGMTAFRAGLKAERDAQAAAQASAVAEQGNPWLPGRINRTAQATITNTNPELAARFKAEAGFHEPRYRWNGR